MNRVFDFVTRLAWAVTIVIGVGWSAPARGQDSSDPATIAAARALAIDGVKLANDARCEAAIEKLQRAESLHHSPVVLGRLGECKVSLGRLVEGTEHLRRLLREPIPENASEAVREAFVRAERVLAEAAPRIASLNITVRGVDSEQVTVTLDGKPVPSAALGVDLPTDPGERIIEASAPGYVPVTQGVSLAAAQRLVVALPMEAAPPAPTEQPSPQLTPAPEPQRPQAEPAREAVRPPPTDPVADTSSGGGSLVPGIAVLTLGAAGLGVGVAFGLAAKSDHDALAARCPNNVCSPDDRDAVSEAKTKGTVATIGVGAGAAAMALGIILLVTSSGDDEAASATPGLELTKGTHAWIGLGEVGVSGSF